LNDTNQIFKRVISQDKDMQVIKATFPQKRNM
jgi:hypothetical protein